MSVGNIKDRQDLGWEKSVAATFGLDYGIFRGLLLDADGTVSVTYEDDTTDTFTLLAGIVYPCWAKKVNSSGTSLLAAQIHVLDPARTS